MKLTRQSTNVEDRTKDTSYGAAHRNENDMTNPLNRVVVNSRGAELATYQNADDAALRRTQKSSNSNPFKKMVAGMDRAAANDKIAIKKNRKAGFRPDIPIPQPRPKDAR